MSSRLRLSRQQIEEELRTSEEKYAKAFRQSPMALILTSAKESRYIEVNESFERITGWRRDEVIGRTSYDIGLWVDPDQRAAPVQRLLSGGTIRNVELAIRTKTGDVRTILASAELIEINGEPCMLASAVDITDLKRAEELRLRYAAIVESSSDAIVTMNLEGVISGWNVAAQGMFGYTEEEAIGQGITMIIPPELWDEQNDILRRVRAGERIKHYETRRVSKDGKTIDVSITTSPVRDAEGRIIGASKVTRDITESKRSEAALRESEERFRHIANTAPVMIWMSDAEKQITYLNQTWLDYTGRSLDAALGHRWIEVLHPDEVERCRDVYVKAFDQREPFQVEHRLRRHDGEYRWAVSAGVPRYNGDGSFAGYIGTAIDVTERKLAEEVLSTVSQRLIEAQEEERAHVARELHDDINQRLTLIGFRLDGLVQDSAPSVAELRQKIHDTREEVANLVKDVQALSHRLHPPSLDYLGIEAAAAGLCREVSRDVAVSFHAENVPAGLSERISVCLYRVLQEALQNATKHSGARHVEVWLRGGADQIELTVHDSGAGFDPEDAFGGRGLGLTSMKKRLEAVNGQLAIDSKPEGGTTIRARVPLPSIPSEFVAGATPPSTPDDRRARLLIGKHQ